MDILDEMEAALRFYANRENVTYSHPYGEGDTIVGPASKALREYESLKGQIAVVPVQTSDARKAALDDFWHITDTGTMEHFVHTHALTIEAALQQPDTSEAVREREELLDLLELLWDGYENGSPCYENTGDPEEHGSFIGNAFEVDSDVEDRICKILNGRAAVIAAMKGVDHGS